LKEIDYEQGSGVVENKK